MAKKIHKQQEKEFYKNYHPITEYLPVIHNKQNTETKITKKQNPQANNKTEITINSTK